MRKINYGELEQATLYGYETSLEHDLTDTALLKENTSGSRFCVYYGDEKYVAEALYMKALGY